MNKTERLIEKIPWNWIIFSLLIFGLAYSITQEPSHMQGVVSTETPVPTPTMPVP